MGERIVYLTNSLVDEGRKNVVALVAANIYTTTTCLTTRDHLTIHPIEPIHKTAIYPSHLPACVESKLDYRWSVAVADYPILCV